MNEAYFAKARRNMVDGQVLPNRVTDERLIEAMETLPREAFLPNARKALAYADESVLIEDGRYLMQPMVLARLLDAADIAPASVALAIGCGSGYGVAVLARLVDTVVAIEPDAGMRAKAEKNMTSLGIDNVAIVDGELSVGHPKEAPFDIIFIDGAVPHVPDGLPKQLSEGGRLVGVEIAPGRRVGRGIVVSRFGESINRREVFDAAVPMLPGFERPVAFSF